MRVSISDDPIRRFRERAEELRTIARGMNSAIYRAKFERLAKDYEEVAQRLEEKVLRDASKQRP